MKKVLLSILVGIFLCSCSAQDKYDFTKISGDEVLLKMANKASFVVMISSDDCYSCDVFKEETKSTLAKNKFNIYELNDKTLDENLRDQLNIALGDYTTWPTIFNVVDGNISIPNRYEYSLDPEGWKTWMKNMGLITN